MTAYTRLSSTYGPSDNFHVTQSGQQISKDPKRLSRLF